MSLGAPVFVPSQVDKPVGGLRPFEHYIRAVLLMQAEKTLVEFAASRLFDTYCHFDTRFPQHPDTSACH